MELILGLIAIVCLTVVLGLAVYVIRTRPAVSGDQEVAPRLDEISLHLTREQVVMAEKFAQIDQKLASFQSTFDKRDGVVEEQMSRIGREVSSVVSLFHNDRTRGSWGELSLERIFEVAGLVEGRDYINQFDGGEGRPDVLIQLPGDQKIVIDSKFPVVRYLDAMACDDDEQRLKLLKEHGRELERVGKRLAKKHYASHSTAGYVIVYVPSQAVYETAAEAYPDVIERLIESNVILAGPFTLFGMIKTAATLLAQHRAVRDAREIVDEVRELRSRLGTFSGHLDKVGNGLRGAMNAYNSAIGSWNSRLSPSVNRIAEMSGSEVLEGFEQLPDVLVSKPTEDLREAV